MISTSAEYDQAIQEDRDMHVGDVITLSDGSQINLDNSKVLSYTIKDATSADGVFEIGSAIAKQHTFTLDNVNRTYDRVQLGGAQVDAKIKVQLSETVEVIRKGIFYITKAYKQGKTMVCEAYDGMVKFNRPYSESGLEYPATVNEIISGACLDCGVPFNAATVENGNFTIQTRPEDESITYRDVIAYCAQLMGKYAKVDTEGVLYFGWYDFDAFITGITDGGWFDEDNPYSSGAALDCGTFNPWNQPVNYDAGTFESMKRMHHFQHVMSEQINENDVTVTGIKVTTETEEVQYGDDGYVLEIAENPLIEEGQAQTVAQYLGNKIIGCRMRPMSISVLSNPAIEAGDVAFVTDTLLNTYQALVTSTTFEFWNSQKVECGAETQEEHEIQGYSALTKAIITARKNTQRQLSDYDKTVLLMTQLISQGMGMYFTKEQQEDGSFRFYLHDQPTIKESSYVCYLTSNGIMASTDGGTSWAIDRNGNALFNVLSVIGFYFDWARGGTLSLGNYNNQDGEIIVRNTSGGIIGRWNRDGIYAANGTFAGTLSAATGTFSGALSGATGTFSGDLSAAGGTFAGDLSAAGGTFAGDLSAAGGTFSGALSAASGSFRGTIENKSSDGEDSLVMQDSAIYVRTRINSTQVNQQIGYIRPEGYHTTISGGGLIEDPTPPALVLRSNYDMKLNCAGTNVFHARYNSNPKLILSSISTSNLKSRLVNGTRHGDRLLYCYETPTPYFGDIGSGKIDEEGNCYVSIDDIFSETVRTDIEYAVFVQKEGQGDIWIEEKEYEYFLVKGTPGLKFSWELKAVQKGFEELRIDEPVLMDDAYENTFDLDENFADVMRNETSEDLIAIFNEELAEYDAEVEEMTA